jgi:hypothetical protein
MAAIKPNAESFRILALASLVSRDVSKARLEIRKALELAPSWESLRFTAAIIDYFSALATSALPDRVVSWPEPVEWSLVKRDDESSARIRAAAKTFRELADHDDKSVEERETLETWYLASLLNDAERHEDAADRCRKILQTNPANFGVIAWAVSRHLDVDLATSETTLKELLKAGAAKLPQILALVSCQLADRRGSDAIVVLNDTRSLFEEQNANQLWKIWYAQALVVGGDPETALAAIGDVDQDPEARLVRTIVLRAISKKSGSSSELVKHLENSYQQTTDPIFVLEACKLKAYEKEWAYVVQRAEVLTTEIGTPDAIRLAVIASFNDERFDLCLALLDANRHVFPNQKLPSELRRLRILSHHRLGSLPTAIAEAESLVSEESTTQNLLDLAQIYFDAGDLRQLTIVARQLMERTDLTAEQSLRIARLIQVEDRELAVSLWRRSLRAELSAEETAMAVSLGYQLGVDDEIRPLLDEMAAYAASGVGPIRLAKIGDLVSFIEQGRVRGQQLYNAYRDVAAPIHLIAEQANIPLAQFYHGTLEDNAAKLDPLNQSSLFARYGGRPVTASFPTHSPKWLLNLDITAILLAEHLGILEPVTKTWKPIRFSKRTISALVEMRDRILPEQPSRLRAYEQVLDLQQKGSLVAIDSDLSPDYQNMSLVQDLGRDWVGLFEKARKDRGYLVDFLPLNKRDLSGPPTTLPDDSEAYLTNCRGIVESLRQHGPLSEEDYLKVLESLGNEGRQHLNSIPRQGSVLYCEGTIPSLLAKIGLLSTVCSRFQVKVEKAEVERARLELSNYGRRNSLAQWITNLMDRIREGLENGSYELIPSAVSKEDSQSDDSIGGLSTACLTDLLQYSVREGDVIWIDDRYGNAFSHRDGAPIITIYEILKALVGARALRVADYYNKIASLRASNIKFIPVERDELLYQLSQAEVDKDTGVLIETQNLIVLRRYVATCLLKIDTPQWPPQPKGSPNENGEIGFFVTLGRAITKTLIDVWKTTDIEEPNCVARSEWLITNLFQEHMVLNNPTFQTRTDEDYKYLVTLRLVDLVAAAIGLAAENDEAAPPIRKRFLEWLLKRVLQKRFDANPYLIAAIANVFKKTLFNTEDEVGGKYPREVAMMVLQNFFEDLPSPLRDELIRDGDFMASIGLKSRRTFFFEGMAIETNEFWRAVETAINGGEATIQPFKGEGKIRVQNAAGSTGQPAVSFFIPANNKTIILDDDTIRLALSSPAEREAVLRSNRIWFDCPSDSFDQAVAQIASTENVDRRIEDLEAWRKTSAAYYYQDLSGKLERTRELNLDDLLPPSAEGMLRYLRFPSKVDSKVEFSLVLQNSAEQLLKDEGLEIAIRRLGGLPVPFPAPITTAIAKLTPAERRNLLKYLLKQQNSPVFKVHVLAVVMLCRQDSTTFDRLARLIIKGLISKDRASEYELFKSILICVNEEFGYWHDIQGLSPRLKLALVWSHSHELYSLLLSAGASIDWLLNRFSNMRQRIPHELFDRDPIYWFDIAHPRQFNRISMLFSGLSYSLSKDADKILDAQCRESIRSEAYQLIEGIRMPVSPLLRDPTLASNSLDSYLGRDRAETLVSLIRDENLKEVSRECLLATTKQSVEKLAECQDDIESWARIFAIMGDMPVYAEGGARLSEILKKIDFCELYEKNQKISKYSMLAATGWASSIRDLQLHEHLRAQLIKMCESEARAESKAIGGGKKVTDTDETKIVLLESALNIARAVEPPREVLEEFRDLVTRIVDVWPSSATDFRPMIERFCDELSIAQVKRLYPLLLRLRAA